MIARSPTKLLAALLFFVLSGAGPANGAPSIAVEIEGNTLTADLAFPSGVSADITVTFENAIGLSADSIGLSAELIDVTDPGLLTRLPDTLTSVPAAFPVMITIEPPVDQGLSFTETATVEIHTHHLTLVTNTPLRLFKAPLGGAFRDITETIGAGSIRSRGRTGGFSQFLIIADLRSHDVVANLKLDGLEDLVAQPEVDDALAATLQTHLDAARTDLNAGNYLGAIDHVEDFMDDVEANSGTGLPNIWRASRDLDNVAGDMMGGASSLRFTLRMANSLL